MVKRHEAFESLVKAHEPKLRRFVQTISADQSSIEDLVQDVFVTAWKRFELLETIDERAVFSWLCGTATRHAANRRRSVFRHVRRTDRYQSQSVIAQPWIVEPESISIDIDVRRALLRLPVDVRMTLLLVLWEDAGPEEIATAMNCSRAAAAKRIQRSMSMLREEYTRND